MRFSALLGLVLLVVARHADAATEEPDDSAIELGPPPPPPPGARVTNPDEPGSSTPAPTAPEPAPAPVSPEPAPLAPKPAPIAPDPEVILEEPEPQPDRIVLSETKPPKDHGVEPSQRSETGRWYGWKILIADGGAFTLAMTSQPLGSVLGGGAYVLTAPAIHLGHKRGLTALGSLGMRIATPLVLHALMGEEPCSGDLCFQPGILLGATIASLVDVIVLARETPDTKSTNVGGIAPVVALTRKSAGIGLSGSF